MTPATTLALARAVYPNTDWFEFHGTGVIMARYTNVVGGNDGAYGPTFSPLHNAAQTLAVLCWLLAWERVVDGRTYCYRLEDDSIQLISFIAYTEGDEDEKLERDYQHDNTPAFLAAAIVEAAGRVIEERP